VYDRWDPHGRSVGPAWQVGPAMWDPRVMCKVGVKKFKCMTGGTRVAGWARRVGPACQDGLTGGTHMSRWTATEAKLTRGYYT
jgi:hypothetical protein